MYAGMTESDLRSIYHYLKTLTPKAHQVERFSSAPPKVPRNDILLTDKLHFFLDVSNTQGE
jgi:hypothetical protein